MLKFPVEKYGLIISLVSEEDADFIVSLRNDPKCDDKLNNVDSDVNKQINWIKNYKNREEHGLDFYFLIKKDKRKIGLIRLYNVTKHECTLGSWVMIDGLSADIPLLVEIFTLEYAFENLGIKICNIDVVKTNLQVLQYHQKFCTKKNEDERSVFLEMNKDQFKKKEKFLRSFLRLAMGD